MKLVIEIPDALAKLIAKGDAAIGRNTMRLRRKLRAAALARKRRARQVTR